MDANTGLPTGELKLMTPYPIANDPSAPKALPDIIDPDRTPIERATARFSLSGRTAIGEDQTLNPGALAKERESSYRWRTRNWIHQGRSGIDGLKATANVHQDVYFEPVDITYEDEVDDAVAAVAKARGVDILLCFAGISQSKLSVEYPIDSWKQIFDVNVHGTFLVARAVARDTIARNGSTSMVFTASMSAHVVNTPQPHPAYAASKAAVHNLARSLAGEWVGHNIRVNSISPGIMNTRLTSGESQAGLRKLWLEKCPMGIGDPEDVVGAVILLCSDAGRFITGTDIKIDGKCL
ncbi:hypothetical protein ACLMJK_007619 [Lecanora helva]